MLRRRAVPLPDAGFDVAASTVGRRAIGVDPRGPAYGAGLRDGMTIVRVENPPGSSRDAAPDAPMTVVVREGDVERAITIVPRVAQVSEFYFERRP